MVSYDPYYNDPNSTCELCGWYVKKKCICPNIFCEEEIPKQHSCWHWVRRPYIWRENSYFDDAMDEAFAEIEEIFNGKTTESIYEYTLEMDEGYILVRLGFGKDVC